VCIVKTPKVNTSSTTKEKDPAIIRNPFLDGVDPTMKSLRTGRSALRIERTGVAGATPPPVVAPTPTYPTPTYPAQPTPGSTAFPNPDSFGGFGGGGVGRIGRLNRF
jgi:hypothetical protein